MHLLGGAVEWRVGKKGCDGTKQGRRGKTTEGTENTQFLLFCACLFLDLRVRVSVCVLSFVFSGPGMVSAESNREIHMLLGVCVEPSSSSMLPHMSTAHASKRSSGRILGLAFLLWSLRW